MSENTLNAGLRRLGYSSDEMTGHGFRAMASTLLNESGKWSADAIERALAHGESNKVRAAYYRGDHWDERVRMAQWLSNHLDQLRSGGDVMLFPQAGTAPVPILEQLLKPGTPKSVTLAVQALQRMDADLRALEQTQPKEPHYRYAFLMTAMIRCLMTLAEASEESGVGFTHRQLRRKLLRLWPDQRSEYI